jgi:serine/threonine protein kinase
VFRITRRNFALARTNFSKNAICSLFKEKSRLHQFQAPTQNAFPMKGKNPDPAGERSGDWLRIKSLFGEALEIDPANRASWLKEKCRDHPALAREVESLLKHHDSGDQFLETPAWRLDDQSGAASDPEEEELGIRPGARIGSWDVLGEIRSGGMGTVYLAERTIDDEDQPARQRAAIKIIRARINAQLFERRFRRERRILARLNHPFIVRFLEGGTLENGLPYFALDYVEGEPIDDYCRNRQFDLPDILELFCNVCSAVAYAHQNLVVHRDLKPSNILVAADGTPRLLDFGIAKLLAEEDESMEQTRGVGPCTPRYSSPEQIRGEPVTTASDVFALGIVLHELVYQAHPFDPDQRATPIDLLRRTCEDEPGGLGGHFHKRRSASERRNKNLSRRDLESIILKALEKTPADRYKSVEHFIDDLQNALHQRPVLARPQSWWYRTRTFARRHPTATLSSSLATAIAIIAFGSILASDRTARQERDYALQQRELAASSARTMINDLASSLESMSAPIERRLELLNRVAAVFDQIDATSRGATDPARTAVQIRAEVRTQLILARALEELGDLQAAIHRSEKAEMQAKRLFKLGATDPGDELVLAETVLEKCRALSNGGRMTVAMGILEQALTKFRRLETIGNLAPDLRRKLGLLLADALVRKVKLNEPVANSSDSLKLLTEAAQYGEQAYEAEPADQKALEIYADCLESLASFYCTIGRFDLFAQPIEKALFLLRDAVARSPNNPGLQQRYDRLVARWRGTFALLKSPHSDAISLADLISMQRKLCAADPNSVALSEDLVRNLGNCGLVLTNQNEYEEAKKLLTEAVALSRRLIAEQKSGFYIEDCAHSYGFCLSHCYFKTGNLEAARRINEEFLVPLTEKLSAIDLDKSNNRFREALCCYVRAEVAGAVGEWSKAEQMFSRAAHNLEENVHARDFPYDKELYGDCLARLGGALCHVGDRVAGCGHIEEGLQIMRGLGERFERVPSTQSDISDAEDALRHYRDEMKNTERLVIATTQ